MNLFIYDDYLKKYPKITEAIEISLNDLHLSGKIIHIGAIKNLKDIIKEEISRGVKTVVCVGNNSTVNKTIDAITNEENIAIGIIPVGKNNSLAEFMGITDYKEAPNLILARRVEKIDLPSINNHYFIEQIMISNVGTSAKIEGQYTISPLKKGTLSVINIGISSVRNSAPILPNDGFLDIYIDNKGKKSSHFKCQNLEIINEKDKLIQIDNSLEIKAPVKIKITGKKVNFIVGKNRYFAN